MPTFQGLLAGLVGVDGTANLLQLHFVVAVAGVFESCTLDEQDLPAL